MAISVDIDRANRPIPFPPRLGQAVSTCVKMEHAFADILIKCLIIHPIVQDHKKRSQKHNCCITKYSLTFEHDWLSSQKNPYSGFTTYNIRITTFKGDFLCLWNVRNLLTKVHISQKWVHGFLSGFH